MKNNKKSAKPSTDDAAEINAKIAALDDWRGKLLARIRKLIRAADPDVVETIKWRKPSNPGGVPVWEHDGILCTGETYKDKVKLTFPNGAALADPAGQFNASLEGVRRAIDFHEGEDLDEPAFKALLRAAVAYNTNKSGGGAPPSKKTAKTAPTKAAKKSPKK